MKALVTLAAALSLSACNAVADTKLAEDGVVAFHQAMDGGQYGAIYDGSASDMKSSTSRDDLIRLLTALHLKLGNFKSGKTVRWNDNANTGGHYVTLNRQAQFERGPGTEEFVFRVEKGKALLAGYHVNSNVLITG